VSRQQSIPVESLKCRFRSTVDDAQQRPGGSLRRALTLLPIAHGIDRHADPPGEGNLGQADLAADAARVGGGIAHRLGIVRSYLSGDLGFRGRIDLAQSTSGTIGRSEPSRRTSTTMPSSFRRALVTMSTCLSCVRLARRDDPSRPAAQRGDDHEQASLTPVVKPIARPAIVSAVVDLDAAMRVAESRDDEGERESTVALTSLALRCVPREADHIARWRSRSMA
jgi:hypothetical protein